MLGLEGEYKTRGVPSLAHESYASDGTLLGAYGASVRKGLLLEDTVVSVRDGAEEEMDRDELCDSAVVDMIAQGNVLEMTEDGVHYIDETLNQGVKEVKEVKETGGKKSIRRLEKAQSRHNVHISRQQLRDLLMSNISPSSVVWGKSFSHFIEKDDSVEVCFQDGSSVDACVLVAADGIYSTVRKQLIPQSEDETKSLSKGLNYLGLMVILGISPVVIGAKASVTIPPPCDQPSFSETGVKSTGESSGSIPPFDSITMTADDSTDIDTATATATGNEERAGTSKKRRIEDSIVDIDYRQPTTAGSSSSSLPPIENIESTVLPRSQCQWLDGSTRVFTMPFDRSHTMWQLSFPCTEEEALILASNPTLLKQRALEQCAGWHSPLVTLLSVTDLGMVSGHPAYDRDPLKISDMLRKAPSSCDSDSTGRVKGNRSGKKQQQHQQQHKNRPLTQSTITSTTSSSNATSSSSDNNSISNSSSNRPDETTSAPQGSPGRALKRVPFCRVTLLGDAAHPMSPFKAQGANQALLDALCLSTALVSSELAKVRISLIYYATLYFLFLCILRAFGSSFVY
jgi:FAD binding domain